MADPWVEEAGPEGREDHELGFRSDGTPTLMMLGNAVQVWALLQDRRQVTVGEAALVFNLTPARVVEAIDYHPWLYRRPESQPLGLPIEQLVIEHEGE